MCGHKCPTQPKPNSSIMFAFDFYIKSKSCNLFVDICLQIRGRTYQYNGHLLGTALNVLYRAVLLTARKKHFYTSKLHALHMWMPSDNACRPVDERDEITAGAEIKAKSQSRETKSKQNKTIKMKSQLCIAHRCSYHLQ